VGDLVGRRLGQYQLRDVIRRGGMSTIYKAWQPSLDRWVAIKVLSQPGDPQFLSRFKLEARSIAQLQHPNILPIHDYGEQDGQAYLVVQYVQDGRTVGDLLDGPMQPARALRLVAHLLAALGYAHGRGIVHRDVKPGNLLMPSESWPMLADFGVAKLLLGGDAQKLTQAGLVVGTAAYMAPEQALGQPVDARTDLYAAGVVLYELLTGQVPFEGDTPVATLMKQAYEQPARPRSLRPELPVEVEQVVLRALAKQPADRFASAEEMAAGVQEALDRLTPAAPRPAAPPPAPAARPAPAVAGSPSAGPEPAPARPQPPPARDAARLRPGAAGWLVVVGLVALLGLSAPVTIVKRQLDLRGPGAAAGEQAATVTMAGLAFAPPELTVARGARVVFRNDDLAPHTVTEAAGAFDSGVLGPGGVFSVRVDNGFEYVCTIHPSMKARIALTG
jgi:plastocyanin